MLEIFFCGDYVEITSEGVNAIIYGSIISNSLKKLTVHTKWNLDKILQIFIQILFGNFLIFRSKFQDKFEIF